MLPKFVEASLFLLGPEQQQLSYLFWSLIVGSIGIIACKYSAMNYEVELIQNRDSLIFFFGGPIPPLYKSSGD